MQGRHQTIAERYPVPIDDGRGFLPDQIGFAAPIGMKAEIKRVATAAGLSASAFIRGAILDKLQAPATAATEI